MIKKIFVLLIAFSFSNYLFCYKIDTVEVYSKSMNKMIKNIVIVPTNNLSTDKLPVVYLLHGASGNYLSWISKTPGLAKFSDFKNILIVCPDGGYNSWYFDSPIDSKYRYETYITHELVNYIDNNYNTRRNRQNRAISGLSMGGHGALYLAFRNSEVFGSAGSISGGLDIRPFYKNWNIAERLGDIDKYPQNWENNTVTNYADSLYKIELNLIIDCGKDDFFINVNNEFHKKLVDRKIDHYYEVKEGRHNWKYFRKSVYSHLNFFHKFFNFAR